MTQASAADGSTAGPGALMSSRRMAGAFRANALGIFPPEAFEEDVVRRRFMGREQIILSRPAGIHRVLVENPDNYRRTAATIRILRPVLGRGLLLAEGDEWRRQRHLLAPTFAPRTIPLVARQVAIGAERAVGALHAAGAAPVDLLAAMQRLTLEIVGRALFSLETERFGGPMRELLFFYARSLGRPRILDFLLPLAIPSPQDLLRWRFRRRWTALIAAIVAERRRQTLDDAPRDLFDLLAAAAQGDASGSSPGEFALADQIATLIVAGHETTALALFWSFYLLSSAPEMQTQLATEAAALDRGAGGAAVSLPKLVRTRAVVQEALRLYPPAFAIGREARAADEADGIEIPRRAIILIAPWVLHHHRRLWREPEIFDPSRFLPGAPPPDRFQYLPFGIGPRTCIGAQFALTEATLVLARLVREFVVERVSAEPVLPVGMVTTRPDHAPFFRLIRRSL